MNPILLGAGFGGFCVDKEAYNFVDIIIVELAVVSDSTDNFSIDAVFTKFLTRAAILSSILILFSDQFFGAFSDTFNLNQQRMALKAVIVDLKNVSYFFLIGLMR